MFDNFGFLQTLPILFMKAQQTKVIPKLVVLQIAIVSNKPWNLRLFYCSSHGPLDFTFTSGWTQFVTYNRIVKGDILVFSKLTADLSNVRVYMFNCQRLPIGALPRSPSSTTRHDIDVEEEKDLVMPHTSKLITPLHQKKLLNNKLVVSSSIGLGWHHLMLAMQIKLAR